MSAASDGSMAGERVILGVKVPIPVGRIQRSEIKLGDRTEQCVLKIGEQIEGLEREARVLSALTEMGLPVPAVLAGPVALTDDSGPGAALLLRELPGRPLPWLALTSLAEADLTCRLLIRGIDRLHALTEPVSRHEIATSLPRDTLSAELAEIAQRGGEWLEVDLFARALDLLPRARRGRGPAGLHQWGLQPAELLARGRDADRLGRFRGRAFRRPAYRLRQIPALEPG
jgi:hypothetical protein